MKKLYLFIVALFIAIAASATTKVYFDNTAGWSEVKIHYWGNQNPTTWPGVNMTNVSGTLYSYDLPDGVTGMIFNNNNGSQTNDITDGNIKANHVYVYKANNPKFEDRGDYETYIQGGSTEVIDIRLKGSSAAFGWGDGIKPTSVNGDKYIWKISELSGEFKFDVVNKGWYGAGNTGMQANTEYNLYKDSDGNDSMTKDVTDATLVVTVNNGTPTKIIVYTPLVLIDTSLESFDFKNEAWKAQTENGVYVWSGIELNTSKFKIGTFDGDRNSIYYGAGQTVALNKPTKIYLSGADCLLDEPVSNATVKFNLNDMTITVTGTVVEIPADAKVYFNAGAAWEDPDKINKNKVYASFIKKGNTEPESSTRVEMTDKRVEDKNAVLPLFFTSLPKNPELYDGVQFESTNGDVTWIYNSKKYATDVNKSEYDAANWWRFIYGVGNFVADENNGKRKINSADQSYITHEDYVARRDGEKVAVFIVGNNIKGDGFSVTSDGQLNEEAGLELSWDGTRIGRSSAKEHVYIYPFTVIDKTKEAKFKMTWIDVESRLRNYIAKYGKNISRGGQRWWATFNVGIVGAVPPPGMSLAEAKQQGIAASDSPNDKISYIVGRTRNYSRATQYDWWIKSGQLDGTENTYLVIDTQYKTTALLLFKPAPNLGDVTSNSIEKYNGEISDDNAATIGTYLKGYETAGEARVSNVNQAKGSVEVLVSTGITLYDRGYTVTYQLYHGDEIFASFDGVKDATRYVVTLNNMPAGVDEKIRVRCLYHDKENDTYIRSHTEGKLIGTGESMPAITTGKSSVVYFKDSKGWHAQVNTDFTIPEMTSGKTLAVYPDFEFSPEQNTAATSVRLASTADEHVKSGIAEAQYTKWESGEYVPAEHNWSTIALGTASNGIYNGHFNFVFENIAGPEVEELTGTYEFNVKLIAAYPFLVNNGADVTVEAFDKDNNKVDTTKPASVRSKAAERTNYSVTMSTTTADATFRADTKGNTSGILDAEVVEDGECILYNLQGIRVEGDVAPGVYIRRNGSKTDKIVIR